MHVMGKEKFVENNGKKKVMESALVREIPQFEKTRKRSRRIKEGSGKG